MMPERKGSVTRTGVASKNVREPRDLAGLRVRSLAAKRRGVVLEPHHVSRICRGAMHPERLCVVSWDDGHTCVERLDRLAVSHERS